MGGVTGEFFPFPLGRGGTVLKGRSWHVASRTRVEDGNIHEEGHARGAVNPEVKYGSSLGGAPTGFWNFGEDINASTLFEQNGQGVALVVVTNNGVATPGANKGVVAAGVKGLGARNPLLGGVSATPSGGSILAEAQAQAGGEISVV